MKLLEESGYEGSRHFDAHAYRTEDYDGVWDFAAGCMRTYLILKEKAQRFAKDKEIQTLLKEIRDDGPAFGKFSRKEVARVKGLAFDRPALARKRLPYEKLDQLLIDLLLGVR